MIPPFDNYASEADDDNSNYDGIELSVDEQIGDIYGDPYEESEPPAPVVQNPYYGDDIETGPSGNINSSKQKDIDKNEVITCTKNVYYEM